MLASCAEKRSDSSPLLRAYRVKPWASLSLQARVGKSGFICVKINTIAWVLSVCLNANSVCFFSPVFMEQATMRWHKGLSFWFDM